MTKNEIFVRPSARKDLRRIGQGPEVKRIQAGLERLRNEDPSIDVKPLVGASPWLRLRVGDYRVCYRPVPPPDGIDAAWVVDRVVHRSDLNAAVASLPAE